MSAVSFFKPENERNVVVRLSLPDDCFRRKFVTITDYSKDGSGEHLVSLHYNVAKVPELLSGASLYTPAEVKQILNVRGVVYDLDTNEIACISYPYTNILPVNSVPLDHSLPVPTTAGFIVPMNGKYFECYGGALYRVYFHNNKERGSTHRKMDADNSHFGRSDNFGDIFMRNQDVFPSLDSIYNVSAEDEIHLFLLNDENLLIDSREHHTENRIFYLGSLSVKIPNKICDMRHTIEQLNTQATKPIHFPKELTPNEVNARLKGNFNQILQIDFNQPPQMINNFLRSVGPVALTLFSDAKRVIYQNEIGIYTLASTPVLFRQRMMDGQANVTKLFTDCIANFYRDDKVMVPYGFSVDALREIMTNVKNGESYDLNNFELITDKPELIVLTNLAFCVPLHLIDECFDAYTSFGKILSAACEFFIQHKERLLQHINNNDLDKFEGMHSASKKMKDYLAANLPKCFDRNVRKTIDSGTKAHWPHLVIELYHSLYTQIAQNKKIKMKVEDLMVDAAIVCLVANATGDCLYALMNFEKKHKATLAAFSRSLVKNDV